MLPSHCARAKVGSRGAAGEGQVPVCKPPPHPPPQGTGRVESYTAFLPREKLCLEAALSGEQHGAPLSPALARSTLGPVGPSQEATGPHVRACLEAETGGRLTSENCFHRGTTCRAGSPQGHAGSPWPRVRGGSPAGVSEEPRRCRACPGHPGRELAVSGSHRQPR